MIVGGALLGAGVPLRAGQRLQVALDTGQVHTDEFQSGDVDTATSATDDVRTGDAAQEASTRAPAGPRSPAADWRMLAEQGDYRRALQAAERRGWAGWRGPWRPGDLLRLGDVARYAGAPAQARRLFEALVERHPGDPLAGDAVFSLGRLESEAGSSARRRRLVPALPARLARRPAGRAGRRPAGGTGRGAAR